MTTPPKYEDLVLKVAELERSEAALREEMRLAKSLQTTTDAIVMMVDAQRDHWIEKCGSLKQRLTVAEQRAAFLERVMRDTLNDEDGLLITAEFNTGPTWSALQKHGRSIEAALKPAADAKPSLSCPNCKVCMGSPDFPENCLINGVKPWPINRC